MNSPTIEERKEALLNVFSEIANTHQWVQQGFWELAKQFFGEPEDDGESEYGFCERVIQEHADDTIAEFFLQVTVMAIKRFTQILVWKEQHANVPADLLEDTVDLRILMEDDNSTDEQIHDKVIQLCNLHGLNYGDIVAQVQEAADRLY